MFPVIKKRKRLPPGIMVSSNKRIRRCQVVGFEEMSLGFKHLGSEDEVFRYNSEFIEDEIVVWFEGVMRRAGEGLAKGVEGGFWGRGDGGGRGRRGFGFVG